MRTVGKNSPSSKTVDCVENEQICHVRKGQHHRAALSVEAAFVGWGSAVAFDEI
jgi:hypothetical protein